jgi:hypothetical protein
MIEKVLHIKRSENENVWLLIAVRIMNWIHIRVVVNRHISKLGPISNGKVMIRPQMLRKYCKATIMMNYDLYYFEFSLHRTGLGLLLTTWALRCGREES